MKSFTTAGSAPGFRLVIRYLDNCSWIVLELFGVVSVTNTYCNKQSKKLCRVQISTLKQLLSWNWHFSGGGVVGIRKCILQGTKKAQNQLNTLHKLMLTIQVLADITEQWRPNKRFSDKGAERTLLKQRKMYENVRDYVFVIFFQLPFTTMDKFMRSSWKGAEN